MAKSVTDKDEPAGSEPEEIEFHAHDRFHAKTHVTALHHLPPDLKHRLHAALDELEHDGPVHVAIPAHAKPAKGHEHAAAPADGAFHVKPFHFVKV